MLDLILSHGESMAQPLSVFRGNQVRMRPRSPWSAPPGPMECDPVCSSGSKVDEGRRCRDTCLPGMVGNRNPGNKSQPHTISLQERLPRERSSWPLRCPPALLQKLLFLSLLAFPSFFQFLFPNLCLLHLPSLFCLLPLPSLPFLPPCPSCPPPPDTHLPSSLPAGLQQQLASSSTSDPIRGLRPGS